MAKQYVERRDDGYWIAGRRVSLESVVYAYLGGQTAEGIAQSFSALTMEEVYGAIAYYLANRAEVDAYLTKAKSDFESKRQSARQSDPMFYQKLLDAQQHSTATHR